MSNTMQATRAARGPGHSDADWPQTFFHDADLFDVADLAAWFADDIEARFGNAPPIHGKPAATEAFRQFFSSIGGMRHTRENVVRDGDTASQQSVVTYKTLDGREVSMPVASYLRRTADGRLDRLWIYIDMAPLFAVAV
jgi:ketosteroid isomerase-like protein